ncbi:MAG: hypothetical protein MI685_11070 [Chlorobiales bacterium]|nr:hypothetical protein [Chlorobiales bacterium]
MNNSVFKLIALFVLFITFSMFYIIITCEDSFTVKRAVYTYFSWTTYFFIFPVVALTEMIYGKNALIIFSRASYIWFVLVLFGLIQVFLHQIGITFSYESLFEYSPNNISSVFGFPILRASSLFGEPRNMAAIIIPVFYLRAFFKGRNALTKYDYILIGVIGILTGSRTFFVFVIALLLFYLFVFSDRKSSFLNYRNKVILIMFLIIAIPIAIDFSDDISPRTLTLIESAIAGKFNPYGHLFMSAADWLWIPYLYDIISFKMNLLDVLFGNGLGSFNLVVDEYFIRIFNFSVLKYNVIQGTHFLIFHFLVEMGLLGVILFLYIFYKVYVMINSIAMNELINASMLKLVVASMFISGMIGMSFVFVVAYIIVFYLYFQEGIDREKYEGRFG